MRYLPSSSPPLAMKSILICLALGAVPGLAGTRDAPITLVYRFQHEPPLGIVESIETELDDIMSAVGLRFEWRSLTKNTGTEVYNELVRIDFKGDCDLVDLRATEGYPGPFGWTHIIDGKVSRFIGINCDGVRVKLQWRLLELPEEARLEVYGRAVARVLAHEICHALLGGKHSSSGIGKSSYSADDLLKKRFPFSRKQVEALRSYSGRDAGE